MVRLIYKKEFVCFCRSAAASIILSFSFSDRAIGSQPTCSCEPGSIDFEAFATLGTSGGEDAVLLVSVLLCLPGAGVGETAK